MLGYLYISPWIIGTLLFTLGPILASAYLSLTDYPIFRSPVYVGLANYQQALFKDPVFWKSVYNTLYYVLIMVPISTAGSFMLALLLNQRMPLRSFLRMAYFLPSVTPVVALSLIWVWIFNPVYGPFNGILNTLGLEQPNWFGSPTWSKPALIIMSLWGSMGGGSMLIFLAGLQGVPVELYEAAEIDGATGLRKFLHITVPMVSPTMFFILVINMIAAFRVFTIAYVSTGGMGGGSVPPGGPVYSTTFYILHLYNNAWRYMQMGYASALGWLFIALVLVLVVAQFRLSSGWVYYEGEVKK